MSGHPTSLSHAPKSVTGSACDQSASRGPASPSCNARSADCRRGITSARKASASSMTPGILPALTRRRTRIVTSIHRGLTSSEVDLVVTPRVSTTRTLTGSGAPPLHRIGPGAPLAASSAETGPSILCTSMNKGRDTPLFPLPARLCRNAHGRARDRNVKVRTAHSTHAAEGISRPTKIARSDGCRRWTTSPGCPSCWPRTTMTRACSRIRMHQPTSAAETRERYEPGDPGKTVTPGTGEGVIVQFRAVPPGPEPKVADYIGPVSAAIHCDVGKLGHLAQRRVAHLPGRRDRGRRRGR